MKKNEVLTTNAWIQRADELAQFAYDNFFINYDRYGKRVEGGKRITSGEGEGITIELLIQHFRGERNIGAHYAKYHGADKPSTCKWMCIDIDAHDDNESVEDAIKRNWADVQKITNWLDKHYVTYIVEDSNGRGGYHIWILHEECNQIATYQQGQQILADTGLDVELNPKQADLSTTSLHIGNWVRLPGKHHKRDHWSKFYVNGQWLEDDDAVEYLLSVNINSKDAMKLMYEATYNLDSTIASMPAPLPDSLLTGDRVGAALKFANKCQPAVEFHGGDMRTFSLMRNLYTGFALTVDECVYVATKSGWNDSCLPPWSDDELYHKAKEAEGWWNAGKEDQPRGHRLAAKDDADMRGIVRVGGDTIDEAVGPESFATFYDWQPDPKPRVVQFPLDQLPDDLRAYIDHVAKGMNTHHEFVATSVFAVVAAHLQNVVSVTRTGFSTIPPTMWAILVEHQAMGKGRGMNRVLAPVEYRQSMYENQYRINKAKNENTRKNIQSDQSAWWKKKANQELSIAAKINHPDYKAMQAALDQLDDGLRSMLVQTSTLQSLLIRMQSTGHRAFLASDESAHVWAWLGKREASQCIEKICQLWDNGDIQDDSINSGYKAITNGALTMLSGIQPHRIDELLKDPEFVDSGFGSRHLFCHPDRDQTKYVHAIPQNITDWWESIVKDLDSFAVMQDDHTERPIIQTLRFTSDAETILVAYNAQKVNMVNRMKTKHDDPMRIGIVNRAENYVMKFALYLHFLKYRQEFLSHLIDIDEVRAAVAIEKYFLYQADLLTRRTSNEIEQVGDMLWKWLTDDPDRLTRAQTDGIPLREFRRGPMQRYIPRTKRNGTTLTNAELIEAAIANMESEWRPVTSQKVGRSSLIRVRKDFSLTGGGEIV